MTIKELDNSNIDAAAALVSKCFPEQSFDERMSFWIYKRQHKRFARFLMRLSGYEAPLKAWVVANDDGSICGTTGIYFTRKDRAEAVWMSWYCVDPDMRGQGIGKMLIEYAIEKANELGKKYFRLYTSDYPLEADAQVVYEKYGFKITRTKKKRGWMQIFRELELNPDSIENHP